MNEDNNVRQIQLQQVCIRLYCEPRVNTIFDKSTAYEFVTSKNITFNIIQSLCRNAICKWLFPSVPSWDLYVLILGNNLLGVPFTKIIKIKYISCQNLRVERYIRGTAGRGNIKFIANLQYKYGEQKFQLLRYSITNLVILQIIETFRGFSGS